MHSMELDNVQVVSLPNEECSVDSLEMEDINQVSGGDDDDDGQPDEEEDDHWLWMNKDEEDDYDDNDRGEVFMM